MPVVLPPPTPKTNKGSQWQQFVNYWAAHGYKAFKQNAQAIFLAAKAEHIDPIVFGALILNESGGHFATPDSKTGAIGIGQLEPGTFIGPNGFNGGVLPWNKHHRITLADLRDRGTNIRLAAAYYGYLQGQYPADAYGRYNAGPNASDAVAGQIQHNFNAKWITPWNKQYVPTAPTSPPAKAGQQVPGGTAPSAQDKTFTDLYVAGVNKQGKFVLIRDPNKALQYDGAPMTRSAFLSLRDQLTSHYVSYTGKRPSVKQIANYIQKGWNPYTLDVLLSKSPAFKSSPIFKQYNANFGAAMKDLLPNGGTVPTELLRQAAVNNWDGNAIAAHLRKQPGYLHSNEFKGQSATLANIYQSIMGVADQKGAISIKDAVLAGWTADQFAAYLRAQPTYSRSPEYQSKSLGFLDALGLLTGAQTILTPGNTPGPGAVGPNTQGKIPRDQRVKGNPNQPYTGLGLMPTLSST